MKMFDRDLDLPRKLQGHFTELTSYNDKTKHEIKKLKLGLVSCSTYLFTKEENTWQKLLVLTLSYGKSYYLLFANSLP